APETAEQLGVRAGAQVRVRAPAGAAELPAAVDPQVPARTVWIPAALDGRAALGPPFGAVTVEAL
ncbi:molybdopterin dinucleotide binding domain-containing protein, partial [Halorhodospira neutriphila]|uniref:molybdopterin dinucleotide binding domain-containing protein n=1 Tax=Halorhodospira neutriphila TaxID=168379 RepID=UPI001906935F